MVKQLCYVLFAGLLAAQSQDPGKAEKPDPRTRAAALLESAAGMVAGAGPRSQISALLDLGEAYELLDKKRALEMFEQAFHAAGVLPESMNVYFRYYFQAEAVGRLAEFSTTDASRLLLEMQGPGKGYDPREFATLRVTDSLLGKEAYDQAIELVNQVAANGCFSYGAAGQILEKLPPGDARHSRMFGAALTAYARNPNPDFRFLLVKDWRNLPPSMAESALDRLVKDTLEAKDDTFLTMSLSSEKGPVNLNSRQDIALFDLIHILRQFNPQRAEEILSTRPQLKAALQGFPEGSASIKEGNFMASVMGDGNPDQAREMIAQQQYAALVEGRANSALKALKDDPQKAISAAKLIPAPGRRAEVLGIIATAVGDKDESTAHSIISQCQTLLKDIKEPVDRMGVLDAVAAAAHAVKDDKLAWELIESALSDAAALYKTDTDSDKTNVAPRDVWPSTIAFNRSLSRATAMFGTDAEPLLPRVTDPELNLFARIQMGRELLGRHRSQWGTPMFIPKRQ